MKESIDMNDAPPLELNNCLYNCSKCSSNIEILSLDENNIKFICNNKHNIEIKIDEYLKNMKQYNNVKLNDDKCAKHKKEYLSYCFDCNCHLCKDCLKTKEHSYHYKINIIEILPENEILNKFKIFIKNNKKKIDQLKKSKLEKETKLNDILNNNIQKIKDIINKNIINNEQKENKELELNNNKYKTEITKLKKEYEDKIKLIKLKYSNNVNDIKNKYKIINNKNENIYNNKIKNLNKKIDFIIKEYKYKEKIEQKINYNEIMEIIYNTYINYNNNYYNSVNMNNIYNYKLSNKITINKIKYNKKEIEEKDKKLNEYNTQINN